MRSSCVHPTGQQGQRAFEQRQLVRLVHRPGDIDQKHQVAWRQRIRRCLPGLQPHPQQMGIGIPGGTRQLGVDPKGFGPIVRCRVVVAEVVDQFLDPHGVGRRQASFLQDATDIGVRRGIDIDTEGRHRLRADRGYAVTDDFAIVFTVSHHGRGRCRMPVGHTDRLADLGAPPGGPPHPPTGHGPVPLDTSARSSRVVAVSTVGAARSRRHRFLLGRRKRRRTCRHHAGCRDQTCQIADFHCRLPRRFPLLFIY